MAFDFESFHSHSILLCADAADASDDSGAPKVRAAMERQVNRRSRHVISDDDEDEDDEDATSESE